MGQIIKKVDDSYKVLIYTPSLPDAENVLPRDHANSLAAVVLEFQQPLLMATPHDIVDIREEPYTHVVREEPRKDSLFLKGPGRLMDVAAVITAVEMLSEGVEVAGLYATLEAAGSYGSVFEEYFEGQKGKFALELRSVDVGDGDRLLIIYALDAAASELNGKAKAAGL